MSCCVCSAALTACELHQHIQFYALNMPLLELESTTCCVLSALSVCACHHQRHAPLVTAGGCELNTLHQIGKLQGDYKDELEVVWGSLGVCKDEEWGVDEVGAGEDDAAAAEQEQDEGWEGEEEGEEEEDGAQEEDGE